MFYIDLDSETNDDRGPFRGNTRRSKSNFNLSDDVFIDECIELSPPTNRSTKCKNKPFSVKGSYAKSKHTQFSSMPDLINIPLSDSVPDRKRNPNRAFFPDIEKNDEAYTERCGLSRIFNFLSVNRVNTTTKKRLVISAPENVCCVSQIIEACKSPKNIRRIRLCKRHTDDLFGLYIRDGWKADDKNKELPRVPGVFVSRFLSNGLAEKSGLLSINDEILEINDTKVAGMHLNEVYKIMVGSAETMILTIKPHIQ